MDGQAWVRCRGTIQSGYFYFYLYLLTSFSSNELPIKAVRAMHIEMIIASIKLICCPVVRQNITRGNGVLTRWCRCATVAPYGIDRQRDSHCFFTKGLLHVGKY